MTLTHPQIAFALALIVGYAAAHAAGLLTKTGAPQWVLGAVTAVLGALAGVLPTVAFNPGDTWETYVVNVFAALIGATLGHKTKIPLALQAKTRGVIG